MLSFLVSLLLAIPAYATVRNVPSQYATIQAGINASVNGDTVLVAPGTYNEQLDFMGKAILLTSESGVSSTLIEGQVYFHNGEISSSVLNGFSIRNINGIGVRIDNSSPFIVNNLFYDNRDQGIMINTGHPRISSNTFSNNHKTALICLGDASKLSIIGNIITDNQGVNNLSAAIYINGTGDSVFITSNVIKNNYENNSGEGCFPAISIWGPSELIISFNEINSNTTLRVSEGYGPFGIVGGLNHKIYNNTFYMNTSTPIAIWGSASNMEIFNNIIYCHSSYGYGIFNGGGGDINITYNCIYQAVPSPYWNVVPGAGEIYLDPIFFNAPLDLSLGVHSPCINAGNPDPQYNDLDGSRSDIGAYSSSAIYPYADKINLGSALFNLQPRLYWSYVDTSMTSQYQYQIGVGTDLDWNVTEMWDSGMISSSDTSAIYAGLPLNYHVRYFLRMRVNNGISWGRWMSSSFIIYQVIHVPVEQTTIQSGIDVALEGDSIVVSPGTYYENINLLGKAIILKSLCGPESTIITKIADGVPIITLESGEDTSTVIDGFTVQNAGYASGIKTLSSSAGTFQNNIIKANGQYGIECRSLSKVLNNKILYNGNGIYCENDCIIEDNLIQSNSNIGIYLIGINDRIIRNKIIENSQPLIIMYGSGHVIERNIISGGNSGYAAVEMQGGCSNVTMSNNTIVNNHTTSNTGAGLNLSSPSHWQIENNIIAYNTGGYGIYVTSPTQNTMKYNDVFGNQLGGYFGLVPGVGSISIDPLFFNLSGNDYSLTGSSPCIDSGDPFAPLDPDGTRADMGALYFNQRYRIQNFYLSLPRGDSVYLAPPNQFIWHSTTDIDSGYQVFYKIFMDDNPHFTSPDSSGVLSDTAYTLSGSLDRSMWHYWRVLAFNYHAVPIYSNETWRFYIDEFPLPVGILAPESGIDADGQTNLIWSLSIDPDSFDAVSYSIQIDNDSTFSSPAINQSGLRSGTVSDDAFAIGLGELEGFPNLQIDTRYFWRVRADDNYGLSSDWTDGSNWFYFMPLNDPPNPPISGFSPSNYEEVISLTPTISWDDATDPDDISDSLRYICQVFTELPGLSAGGVYYFFYDTTDAGVNRFVPPDTLFDNFLIEYHVKTLDPHGLTSEWSEYQVFWTNHHNFPPEPFPLIGPADSTRQIDYYTHFAWDEPYDLDPNSTITISLEISQDSLFNQIIWSKDSLQDFSLNVATDSIGIIGPSYWRVLATDDDGLVRVGGIPEGPRYLMILPPGDANTNGVTNGLDVTFMVNYLKGLGPAPDPLLAGDANGSCVTNGLDVIYLVNYLKGIGNAPVRGQCEIFSAGGSSK